MNFNNSRFVDHKPMKFGTFVPYMYRFVIIVKYLTNFFKLEWNLGIKFTLRFFFLSVYYSSWIVSATSEFQKDSAGLSGTVRCSSDWGSGDRRFDLRRVRQHLFLETDHKIFLYGHSLPSSDSVRAAISFWRKNVHKRTKPAQEKRLSKLTGSTWPILLGLLGNKT